MTLPDTCDVAIIGAGPAGLSAAVALRAAGVARVLVLEREADPGGIPRHCGHSPYGLREFRRLMHGPAYARRLATAATAAGAEIHCQATVTALHPGGRISLSTPDGLAEVTARRVLLATGCRETPRSARLIGGEKPGGILNTGALQGMVYLGGQVPFRRPLILGSELVAFSALMTCRHAGIRPVALVEPGPRTTARWPVAMLPRMLGVEVRFSTDLTAIHGHDRVTHCTLNGTEDIACDGVILTGQFRPDSSLARMGHLAIDPDTRGPRIDADGRTSDPVVFAAGNVLRGVETAGHCWAEGRRIAASIAADLTRPLPPPALEVETHGPFAWVLPRLLRPGATAQPALTLRLSRPARGRLSLSLNGAELLSRPVSSRPERRLSLPLSGLPVGAAGILTLRLDEDA
jgi:NADPH-dependent 2,4-dienoyl-CoA reductase/sulfur reductase-like enzyme